MLESQSSTSLSSVVSGRMTSWIGVVTTQLTDKTGFDIGTTPVTLYTDIEHKTQLIFDVNMQMLLLLLLVYYYYYSTFGFCVCVPLRVTSCLFSVLDSQPTATELFPVAAVRIWNSLPQHVTSAPSLPVFCTRLKTYFFELCYS